MIPPTTYHQRIWAIQTPEATEVFAASCGLENRIRRVLAARINIDVRENWASKHHSGGGIQGKNLKKISTVQQWTENPTEFYKRPAMKPFFFYRFAFSHAKVHSMHEANIRLGWAHPQTLSLPNRDAHRLSPP